jgi:BirA family biotin operon repressor/biotin-[acetyl-CoA-carboxylase] ligase
MHLIKLDATDSTNAHLRRLLRSVKLADYTVVKARKQEQGRGQMGTQWQSKPGKNLTFSVLRKDLNLPVDQGFVLNLCVSLAIYSGLKDLRVPDLSVKWPNDILSGTDKICGILIENKLSGSAINTSIIGIGLNVNQLTFGNLENVSSLKLLLNRTFDLDGLLYKITQALKIIFARLETNGPDDLWNAYEKLLFRKGKPSTFEDSHGELFRGRIEGVTQAGKLIVALEGDVKKEFALKEVKLLP